jgi:hypothetical protein
VTYFNRIGENCIDVLFGETSSKRSVFLSSFHDVCVADAFGWHSRGCAWATTEPIVACNFRFAGLAAKHCFDFAEEVPSALMQTSTLTSIRFWWILGNRLGEIQRLLSRGEGRPAREICLST